MHRFASRGVACHAMTLLLLSTGFACPSQALAAGPTVSLSTSTVRQGNVVGVTVAAETLPPAVRFVGRIWPMYRSGLSWRTYVGTDPTTRPGRYVLEVWVGGRLLSRDTVVIVHVAFPVRRLTLTPDKAALLNPKLVAEEQRKVGAALRVLSPRQLWQGLFALPVQAPLASGYGVLSIYRSVVLGFHGGVDFAAEAGTPVHAANAGIVRLAELLPLSGNAVLIDHGMGIITSYLHLSAIDITVGQHVEQGAILGRVGSTGLATGPHLHWGLRTNGVYVDPMPWTRALPFP